MGTVRAAPQGERHTSAFKKRKAVRPDGTVGWVVIRPKFRELLSDLAASVIDGVDLGAEVL
jgi:hypothetical protein